MKHEKYLEYSPIKMRVKMVGNDMTQDDAYDE